MMTKTVIITLSVATGYMVFVIGLMLYCRYDRRRRKRQYAQHQTEGSCLSIFKHNRYFNDAYCIYMHI